MDVSIFPPKHWFSAIADGHDEFPLTDLTFSLGDERYEGSGKVTWSRSEGFHISGLTDGARDLMRRFGRLHHTPGKLIPPNQYLQFEGTQQDGTCISVSRLQFNSFQLHTHSSAVLWEIPDDEVLDDLTLISDGGGATPIVEMLLWPLSINWTKEGNISVDMPHISEYKWSSHCRLEYVSEIGDAFAGDVGDQMAWWKVKTACEESAAVGATSMALSFLTGRVVFPIATLHRTGKQTVRRIKKRKPVRNKNHFAHPLPSHAHFPMETEKLVRCATNFFSTDEGRLFARTIYPCWELADATVDVRLLVACVTLEGLLSVLANRYQIPGGLSVEECCHLEMLYKSADFGNLPPVLSRRIQDGLGSWKRVSPSDVLYHLREKECIELEECDIKAWKTLRHPAAHGEGIWDSACDQQTAVDSFNRVSSLIVKITLNQMGYEGKYFDVGSCKMRQFVLTPIED